MAFDLPEGTLYQSLEVLPLTANKFFQMKMLSYKVFPDHQEWLWLTWKLGKCKCILQDHVSMGDNLSFDKGRTMKYTGPPGITSNETINVCMEIQCLNCKKVEKLDSCSMDEAIKDYCKYFDVVKRKRIDVGKLEPVHKLHTFDNGSRRYTKLMELSLRDTLNFYGYKNATPVPVSK